MMLLVWAVAAQAQSEPQLNVQHFDPAGGAHGFATVYTARALPAGEPTFDLYLNYAHQPFNRSVEENGQLVRADGAIESLFSAHLRGGYAATSWLDLGVGLPVAQIASDGAALVDYGGSPAAYSLGDVRIDARFVPIDDKAPLGVAVTPFVTIPTGNRTMFLSHGVPTAGGTLAVSKSVEGIAQFGAFGGFRFAPGKAELDSIIAIDDAVLFGAGVGVDLVPDTVRINVEARGETTVGAANALVIDNVWADRLHTPLELVGDLRYHAPGGMLFTVGGGPGLTPAPGTPAFRVFGSVGYARIAEEAPPPEDPDRDKDGLLNEVDRCPDDPEDFDEFEDEDGCPELDNDRDRIPDLEDACPNDPEDRDGFEDMDGCPDPDNDQDGFLDPDDRCPNDPEDMDGDRDDDGCPEEPGDRDGDGLLDPVDACPDEPETYNAFEDEDGCPDEAPPQRVFVEKERIRITEMIYFDYNKASIRKDSYSLLDEIAAVILDHPEITKIRVEGHTDSDGNDDYNLKLSQARAESVVNFLIASGIESSRMVPRGFGETQPVVANDTDSNKQLNRRVEFIILETE